MMCPLICRFEMKEEKLYVHSISISANVNANPCQYYIFLVVTCDRGDSYRIRDEARY